MRIKRLAIAAIVILAAPVAVGCGGDDEGDGGQAATPEPTAAPPTEAPPTAAPAPSARRTYTVQPGDTLLSIARQFNTTVTAIVEANNLTAEQADALRVGQELVIPYGR